MRQSGDTIVETCFNKPTLSENVDDTSVLQTDGLTATCPTYPVEKLSAIRTSDQSVALPNEDSSVSNDDCSSWTSFSESENISLGELADRGWHNGDSLEKQPQKTSHEVNGFVLPNPEASNFGHVEIENSNNVHLGNRTFYKGPITIKQIVYANSDVIIDGKANVIGREQRRVENSGVSDNESSVVSEDNQLKYTRGIESQNLCHKALQFYWKHKRVVNIAVISLILLAILCILLFPSSMNTSNQSHRPATPNDSSTTDGVSFVSRAEWLADLPDGPRYDLAVKPPGYAIICHTVSGFCRTKNQCIKQVQNIQSYHMSEGYGDISYNFLIGGDGNVYVGRGWEFEGAHTQGYNQRSLAVAFIGDFRRNKDTPSEKQLEAGEKLLKLAVKENKLTKDYKLLGQSQVMPTESPGKNLYEIIQKWEHWVSNP